MPDFSAALKVKAADVEPPKLPPVGHYIWEVIKREFRSVESDKGKWDVVEFTLQAREVQQDESGEPVDVDTDALAEFGGVKPLRRRLSFMFTKGEEPEDQAAFDRTKFYMTEFLTKHLDQDDSGELGELIDSAIGKFCIGDIKHTPNPKRDNEPFAEIGRTAPLT